MTQNVMQTTNTLAVNSNQGPDSNIWQLKSANGEALWFWISSAFAAYWVLFAAWPPSSTARS